MSDPDVCPNCQRGRYDRATGVVNLVARCCAVYFYGEAYGSVIWTEYERLLPAPEIRVLPADPA